MDQRGVSGVDLARALGVRHDSVSLWRWDKRIPSVQRAEQMAEVLNSPMLYGFVKRMKTRTCPVCEAEFVAGHKAASQRFCSQKCFYTFWRRQEQGERVQIAKVVRHRLDDFQRAVSAYCDACEAGGLCRTPACPLRPVSPLPLAHEDPRALVRTAKPRPTASILTAQLEQQRRQHRRSNREHMRRKRAAA